MTYEKPQKENPHRITVNQHTLPEASIARFENDQGNVKVYLRSQDKIVPMKRDNKHFCALRAWDQQAESGFMKEVEDRFQELAKRIMDSDLESLGTAELEVINKFYCLWNIRTIHKKDPIVGQQIDLTNVVGLSHRYTQDEEEQLEKGFISFIRSDYTIPGRFLASMHIALNLKAASAAMGHSNWRILRALDGEFIVPDNARQLPMLPLGPTACLWYESTKPVRPVEYLTIEEVAWVNQQSLHASDGYFFARDLTMCPGISGDGSPPGLRSLAPAWYHERLATASLFGSSSVGIEIVSGFAKCRSLLSKFCLRILGNNKPRCLPRL